MATEKELTDTIARVTIRDLFLVLGVVDQHKKTTLENIRLHLCVTRKKKRRGDYLWSAARDLSSELHRLGYLNGGPSPKNSRQFAQMCQQPILISDAGGRLLSIFRNDRAVAYDAMFLAMFARHPYLRAFVKSICNRPMLAPLITSARDHVSERYSSARVLADDIAKGDFDEVSLLKCLELRLERTLSDCERKEIVDGVNDLVKDAGLAAVGDSAGFAKNVIGKLNEIVIPALFRDEGLGFDYRTHRTLWTMGQEFQLWGVVRSHPKYNGWYIYRTSRMHIASNGETVERLEFDCGLITTRRGFLGKLFDCYQELQSSRGGSFVPAWELRSVFCVAHRCQTSVFDKVFAECYAGNDEFQIQAEIQRQKPQHEGAVRAGGRNIGSIRVIKR